MTPNSQVLNYQGINSPVVAIELPADRGEYSINITSIIGDTAFVPNAVIYDENGRELERYGKDSFEYAKPRLHLGNRLVAETILPPTTAKSVYLVIYTDQSDLGGFTDVIHPARLDAEGRGNYLPEVKDIPIPNANVGKIEVTIDKASFFSIGSSSSESNAKPAAATKIDTIQPETQTYYHNAIQTAVAEDNIPKALSLLDEAKSTRY